MENLRREFLPYFLLIAIVSIATEIYLSRRRGLKNYDRKESLISFAIYALGMLANSFFSVAIGAAYFFFHQHSLFNIHWSIPIQFGVVFLGVEFLYYWMHRYSHEVRLGWTSHLVHHSPEIFNFSAAYRLGLTNFFSFLWAFYLPLAWFGFDLKVIGISLTLNLLYQFWLHTELIRKLGPLEWFFNTPSHHRVHHASNELYLDKNYGGTLILFDRLFGTFQAEDEQIKIKYGLTQMIENKTVFGIAFLGWTSLYQDLKKHPGNFLRILLKPPGWSPESETKSAR